MPRTIVVIGGFVKDLVSVARRVPDSGETIDSDSFSEHPGGKGANSAVASYRLSHTNTATAPSHPVAKKQSAAPLVNGVSHEESTPDVPQSNTELPELGGDQRDDWAVEKDDIQVRMTGALGDDSMGHTLKPLMEDNGVDVSQVRSVPGKSTGVGVVLVETMVQENRILFTPGANHDLEPSDFETLESLNGGDGGGSATGGAPRKPDLLISQMELRKETVVQVLRTASKHRVTTLLNPAPAHALELEVYRMVSHLVVNETEAAILADIDVATMTNETVYGHVTDIFLRKGVPNVVVTLGPKGAYYSTEIGKGGLVAAEQVTNVTDTTGAGDTFVGAYGVEVVRQMDSGVPFDIERAVQFACKASAIVIQKLGCLKPIPWLDEVGLPPAGQEP